MIQKKLLDFQRKNITLKKDGNNTYHHSKYVTLNEVLDKVKVALNELGIVVIQSPGSSHHDCGAPTSNPVFGLRTQLVDTEDDTKIESFIPFVNATDMQKVGSAITYARRYSLVAMLGLEDEDDDGNTASARTEKKDYPKPPVKTNQEEEIEL